MNPQRNTPERNFIELPAFDGSVPAELSADYILPDTYPDVKRLLRVDARPVLIGRYISGRRLEFNGAVDYIVLFCADTDSGEALHCVHFAGEWNSALGDVADLDGADISIVPRITACTARLANPRKLSIRTGVACDVKVASLSSCTARCEGAKTLEEELRLERLTQTTASKRSRTFVSEPLRISENLETDSSAPAIDEIIACDVRIRFHEARPDSGDSGFTVALKGTAFIDCIYKSVGDTHDYRSFTRKLPISHIVGADDYADYFESCRPETMCARAVATPVEINAVVGEDNYGERRVVELDMTSEITVRLMGGEDVPLTLDAYSVERDSECVFAELECTAPAKIFNANFSVGESAAREELKIPENASPLSVQADVTAGTLTIERGRGILTGTAAISCILTDAEGGFVAAETELPIRCELNMGDTVEPIAMVCDMCASDMRMRIDAERVYFDFEVSLTAEVCERSRRRTVECIRLTGEPRENERDASMTLYYPSPEDTLWQVAKRYGTTVGAIESANKDGSHVLVIPCDISRGFIM